MVGGYRVRSFGGSNYACGDIDGGDCALVVLVVVTLG